MKIKIFILALIFICCNFNSSKSNSQSKIENEQTNIVSDTTIERYNSILKVIEEKAVQNKYRKLPIGESMILIAKEFIDIPYYSWTLENEPEKCKVFLDKLDCVTFFENTLAIANLVANKMSLNYNYLCKQVEYTRYRNSVCTDYTSRLHYTSDWIDDNIKKNVVVDITKDLGGIKFDNKVSFMSSHPNSYSALKNHPEYISTIKKQESDINSRIRYYIPKDKVKAIEDKLQSGDIIAITTNIDGLDYSHTGMIYKSPDGVAHFFHASSSQKKVVIDKSISEYLSSVKKDTGITVLRPIKLEYK